MNIYKEITEDNGIRQSCSARDNLATYIVTSAHAHDLIREYIRKYDRLPSAKWYNKHFNFKKTKITF